MSADLRIINLLIKRQVDALERQHLPNDEMKELVHATNGSLVGELTDFLRRLCDDPEEFIQRVGNSRRELYTPKEILAEFNRVYEYESTAYLYIRRIMSNERFAAHGQAVSFRKVLNKSQVYKLVALKNHIMWHNATKQEVLNHLKETMKCS